MHLSTKVVTQSIHAFITVKHFSIITICNSQKNFMFEKGKIVTASILGCYYGKLFDTIIPREEEKH